MHPDHIRRLISHHAACWRISVLATFIVLIGQSTTSYAQSATVSIVYPKNDHQMIALDSTFILGNAQSTARRISDLRLTINDVETDIHQDGGWLGWVAVKSGRFPFVVKVFERKSRRLLAVDSVVVNVAQKSGTIAKDSLVIAGDYLPPRGDLVLLSGDQHNISMRGTPGGIAWVKISGVVDSLPLYERTTQGQAYWGSSVFGSAAPDTNARALSEGIYTNVLKIQPSMRSDSTPIEYLLSLTSPLKNDSSSERRRTEQPSRLPVDSLVTLASKSGYRVSVNPPNYPMTVYFADTTQTIRHLPQSGYFSIYQPMGIVATSVGAEGLWHKLRLSSTQIAWASGASLDTLPFQTPVPVSQPTTIRTFHHQDSVTVECILSARHPFRLTETDDDELVVDLFGVTSNVDWTRYDFADSSIESIQWSQPEPEHFSFRVKTRRAIWGYDAYYRGTTFVLVFHHPPDDLAHLKGKRIVVDAGHSADPGSIGPTGLTEKEANLLISLELARELRAAGAEVIMTRADTSHVPLNSRPQIAKKADADLFVSIHNNALPDGVNPKLNNGVATFFYQPHSMNLARTIQKELLSATGSKDYGLYNGNFAVVRPTSYPAVLVECAFMILPEDEARLKTPEFRTTLSKAITNGIRIFLKESARRYSTDPE